MAGQWMLTERQTVLILGVEPGQRGCEPRLLTVTIWDLYIAHTVLYIQIDQKDWIK